MKLSSAVFLLAAIGTGSAFGPNTAFTTRQNFAAVEIREQATKVFAVNEDDTNFEGMDLESILGAKRLSNIRRKLKRERNSELRASSSDSVAEVSTAKPLGIIIAGAPASGKGTQCEKIVENYNVVHLSTGDMLRAAVAAGTEVGVAAKGYMDAGKLVPDEVIIGIVKDRLAQSDCKKNGWLLDGFPRTEAQAVALSEAGITADCFVFLNVPDEVLVERVVGRRTDPETGKIYHMTFSPPDDEEVLARLEQRSDDTEEKVKVRLEQFHTNVAAVKGSYEDISIDIDGTQKPDTVAESIRVALQEKL